MSNDKEVASSDDRDLVELFDSQQESVPEALDKYILNAAQDAVSQTGTTDDRQTGVGIKGWFAIAATLLLGVTITPLLLQSPESALKSTTSRVTATADAASESAFEPESATQSESRYLASADREEIVSPAADAPILESPDNQISADSAITHEQAGIVAASPMVSAIRAPSPTAKSERGELVENRNVPDEPLYRQSAKDWIKEISRLVDDKNPDKAQTEYDLFRKVYPEYEPDFQLDY
ncbi:hypothetical protein [Granulosicoccus antarcticus]|uniref:Uncharacterized protein n=1 Tax=Granulosicoccus antarcticus IMCC3135 TaxID=1192854 RepID=A0A2Z2NV86_9GAMM|nr:hypothetical protein [Granulosicoccus antarcticus]ASJ75386.1 hypothetical protein IMCC3135_26655 [Granulosicoccus antarcticus IMCC3135]